MYFVICLFTQKYILYCICYLLNLPKKILCYPFNLTVSGRTLTTVHSKKQFMDFITYLRKEALYAKNTVFGIGVNLVTTDRRNQLSFLLQELTESRLAVCTLQGPVDVLHFLLAPFCHGETCGGHMMGY